MIKALCFSRLIFTIPFHIHPGFLEHQYLSTKIVLLMDINCKSRYHTKPDSAGNISNDFQFEKLLAENSQMVYNGPTWRYL